MRPNTTPQTNEGKMREPENSSSSRISRRRMLGGLVGASFGAAAHVRSALAQQLQIHRASGITPKPKGPLVFLDYDQEELDDAYTQALWAPNQAELEKRNAQKSAQAIA